VTVETLAVTLAALAAIVVALLLVSQRGRRRARAAAAAAGPIMLGGRGFVRAATLSVARDEAFMELAITAGVSDPDPLPGEELKAYSERILCDLVQAKVIRPMLACLIVPLDTPIWTPAIADETVQFLGTLDDDADKERYYALVAELLLPFYRSGLASWARSRACGSQGPASGSARPASSPASAPATGGA
jgi:hypothetical protein